MVAEGKIGIEKMHLNHRWLNFHWIEARSQIDQSCTAKQPMRMRMMMWRVIIDHGDDGADDDDPDGDDE